jgi:hypothetical protein
MGQYSPVCAYRSHKHWRRFSVRAGSVAIACALANSVVTQVFAQTDDQTPSGMVAFFMFSGTTCPDGWTAPSAAQGRLILGVTDPARVGSTAGTPMADTPPVHTHPFQTTITLSERDVMLDSGCENSDGAGTQTANVPASPPGTTNGGTADPSNLPFIQLVACRKN